jgi:hypothetical protein
MCQIGPSIATASGKEWFYEQTQQRRLKSLFVVTIDSAVIFG